MKKALTEQEKISILTNMNYKSLGKISQLISRPKSTVASFVQKWKATKTILCRRKNNSGRKKSLLPHEIKRIEKFVDKNPKKCLREVKTSLNLKCSHFPISKCLRKLGFKNLTYRHKPILSEDHKLRRLEFARKYKHWNERKWKKVLFSDESSVQIGKHYPRKIWLKPENRWKVGFYLPKKQDYGKKYIKVWSCFSYNGVGKLVFVENGWNKYEYKKILNENLINEAHRLVGKDFIFQEDGDTVHKSKVLGTWKRKNNINVLEFPASSCDIAPIENLWYDFKRRLSLEKQPSNIEEFKLLATRIWNETNISICHRLTESMPRRLRAVLSNGGGVTKY